MTNSNAQLPKPRHRWFAAAYDRMSKMDEKRSEPIRRLLAGGATGRVLEVGCGTGLNLLHYDWPKLEGLDETEPDTYMLRRARARAESLLPEARAKIRFHEAPAEMLPFAEAAFDTVVVTLVFCTVSDLERSIAETARVLRPGGQLRLVEHVSASGFTGKVQRVVQPVYGWMAAGCQLTRDTESALNMGGFDLEVLERTSFGPLWPCFVGVATKSA